MYMYIHEVINFMVYCSKFSKKLTNSINMLSFNSVTETGFPWDK